MAHLAPNYEERQEFWKPAVASRQEAAAETTDQVCQECGTDFVLGSRFCYVCGADRHANLGANAITGLHAWIDFASLRETLGQSNASLVALVMGFACVIAAIVTGFVFTATTLLDWQAVQLWRIEWLLGAVAMFAAGFLLKKK
jgi:vacuolar-type H+-ATPase subunit I/STV1